MPRTSSRPKTSQNACCATFTPSFDVYELNTSGFDSTGMYFLFPDDMLPSPALLVSGHREAGRVSGLRNEGTYTCAAAEHTAFVLLPGKQNSIHRAGGCKLRFAGMGRVLAQKQSRASQLGPALTSAEAEKTLQDRMIQITSCQPPALSLRL